MRASTIVRSVCRDLAYELVCVNHECRAISHQGDVRRAAKKISGYVAAVIAISLAINVILSVPRHASGDRRAAHSNGVHSGAAHSVVNGLHIGLPENLRGYPIEQLVPLP
jgi:hypothetical protein